MKYFIRQTKHKDLPAILELVKEFHAETLNEFGVFCNEEVAQELMPKLIDTSLVLIVDDKLVGVIAGFITNHIVSKEPLFQEVMWYVSKEHRRYGIRLYLELEKWCKGKSIKQMVMVNMGGIKDNIFKKFYESQGYRLLETQYIKNLED